MTSLKSFLNKSSFFFLACLICLPGCVHLSGGPREEASGQTPPSGLRIAVMPIANLSGTTAPLQELRRVILQGLAERGIPVLPDADLEKFMDQHRLRYTAGLGRETGKAFKEEAGVDQIMIVSVDLYSTTDPPKIALTARLVSTGEDPKVVWMDSSAAAGDDAPGLLGLGLIEDPRVLAFKTVRSVLDSLQAYRSGRSELVQAGRRFEPRTAFRSPVLMPDLHYRIAVVPFYNKSLQKNAGEIMALQFVRALTRYRNFEVIDPGVIRERLLRYRIIMDHGVSIADADVLFQSADVDLILGGTVYDYEDIRGNYGTPKVSFSVQLLEKKSRETVWSSDSFNQGDDGVFFFNRGRVSTADAMAKQMAHLVVDRMVEK